MGVLRGRLHAPFPRSVFDFFVGLLRWGTRVNAYVFLMTDRYPPFSLEDDPDYPARVLIEYPEGGVDRWRPFFAWLLILPYALIAYAIGIIAGFAVLFGFFTILFTKRFPEGLFNMALVSMRWNTALRPTPSS